MGTSTLEPMQKSPPNDRLNYITEALIVEGATVRYSPIEDEPGAWMIHVFEPEFPKEAFFKRHVSPALADDDARCAQLRSEITDLYKGRLLN